MVILLTLVHVVVCFFLVIVVLLQSGKAADLAGAFGGMGSQTAFGPRGSATVLSKATTLAAVLFMVTSLTLGIMATRSGTASRTVLETEGSQATPVEQPQPGEQTTVTVEGNEGQTQDIEVTVPPAPAESQAEQEQAPEE